MSTCYYPDGTESDDVPCNSTATHSACCGSSAYCLGNGLCLVDGLTSRGSCTDKSWDDDACTQYCKDSNESGGTPLRLCAINGNDPNSFSCGTSLDNCVSGINTFTVTSNVIVPRATQLSAFASSAGSSLVAAASASASATSTSSSQNGTSPGGGPGGPGDDGYTGAQMAGLGVGVGVPFALAFFVTLVLLARERKRNKALMAGGASAAAYDPLKQQEGDAGPLYVQPQQHQQQPYAQSELGTEGSRHELPTHK